MNILHLAAATAPAVSAVSPALADPVTHCPLRALSR